MANGNHANYAAVGMAVVLGVVGIVGTLFWIGGAGADDDVIEVETYFDKSVSGLSVGSAVNFRGVKIGEVKEISFVGNKYLVEGVDNQRIYVLMAVRKRYLGFHQEDTSEAIRVMKELVRRGMRATVSASGVTGLSRIECDVVENPPPVREISWHPATIYVPPAVSLLESFSDAAVRVMNQINRMDMTSVWSNINATVESLAKTSEGAERMLQARQSDVEKIVQDFSSAAATVKELVEEVKGNPSLLVRERTLAPLPETSR